MTTEGSPDRFHPGDVPEVEHAEDPERAPVIHASSATPSADLVGRDLVVGDGPVADVGDTVRVHYVGALHDTGEEFDSSWGRGEATFPLSGVIQGFRDGIAGMRVGGRRVLVIPSDQGYGAAGAPPVIPGGATLVFVIDLVGLA